MELPELPRGIRALDGTDPLELARALCATGNSDGLPVIPPTHARVVGMLGGREAAESLGRLPPLFRDITVEDVAVCAVLAGCGPEHLPALLSAVRAVQDPQFNLLGVATTTGTTAVGMILHGPYVQQVGANSGSNSMGSGNVANAALGRALALVLRAGGMIPGTLDMSTMGQPAKYGFCFAEAPHARFPSLLSRRGAPDHASAVSVFAASGIIEVVDSNSESALGLIETLASALPVPGTVDAEGRGLGGGEVLVAIPPEWADRLHKDGITQEQACILLYEGSVVDVDRLAPAIVTGLTESVLLSGRVSTARDPGSVILVVTGGIGTKATYIPTWQGGSSIVTAHIT
jgi:hypothetical protein